MHRLPTLCKLVVAEVVLHVATKYRVFLRLVILTGSKSIISLSINLAQHSISLETMAQHEYIIDSCQTFVQSM